MRYDAFIGGSYQSQAVTADCERTINWYPEMLESKEATTPAALYPTPGVVAISANLSGNGRAHLAINGREFAIIGTSLVEVARDGGTELLGTVAIGDYPATINANGDLGNQLFVTSGGNGYVYDLGLRTLTQIAGLSSRATMGSYLDGYFIALDVRSSTFYISALGDGASWSIGTDFAQRSLAPDNWKAVKVVGRYVWLFGESTTEIWQDTGAEPFPFAPFPGTLFEYGIIAPFSACVVGNDIVWLGRSKAGKLCVLRGTSPPTVISNYPLESALADYIDLPLAVGDSYSDKGHTFYLLSVEKANVTWAWDETTGLWAERGTWLPELNRFTSWRPRFYAYAYDQHRMLDSSSGQIYRMGSDLTTDVDGLKIRRVRRAPAIMNENKPVFYSEFELDLEVGLKTVFPTVDAALIPNFTWIENAENPEVTFDASTSVGAATYEWDFGDGNTDTGVSVNHVYSVPPDDTFTVTLTVTNAGATNSVTLTASVTTNYASGMSGSASGPTTTSESTGHGPQVMLRISNDSAKTWIAELWRSAGAIGKYLHRVRWNRLGSATRRVFEVSVTDPVPWRVTGAYLRPSKSTEPGG